MRNFRDTFETRKWSIISAFSICMTVPLLENFIFCTVTGGKLNLAKCSRRDLWYIVFSLSKVKAVAAVFFSNRAVSKYIWQKGWYSWKILITHQNTYSAFSYCSIVLLGMTVLIRRCLLNQISQNYLYVLPENVRKPLVFWYFHEV